jgi:hypothetical protein
VTAENARKLIHRFPRRKHYSPAERRAIHRRALILLARLKSYR